MVGLGISEPSTVVNYLSYDIGPLQLQKNGSGAVIYANMSVSTVHGCAKSERNPEFRKLPKLHGTPSPYGENFSIAWNGPF